VPAVPLIGCTACPSIRGLGRTAQRSVRPQGAIVAFELFRMMRSVLSRRGSSSEAPPDPGFNTTWITFVVCASVLIYVEKWIVPTTVQSWLADLAGPDHGRALRPALVFIGPLALLYSPFYYYVFHSTTGKKQQLVFDARFAPELNTHLPKWRAIFIAIFLLSLVPLGLSSYFPFGSALASVLLVLGSSALLKRRFSGIGA